MVCNVHHAKGGGGLRLYIKVSVILDDRVE